MGEPKIGDKVFLYGQFLVNLDDFSSYEYNSLMGYVTTGGYFVKLEMSDKPGVSVPGFLVDFCSDPVYTLQTTFSDMEDVTDRLSMKAPGFSDTRVWAPIN